MMRAYYRRLTSTDREGAQCRRARLVDLGRRDRATCAAILATWPNSTTSDYAAAFARIECHYFVNGGFLRRRRPAAARCAKDAAHSRRDRAGSLRRGVPDAQRLASASRLAGGAAGRRAGCRTFGFRARHREGTAQGDGWVRAPLTRRSQISARSSALRINASVVATRSTRPAPCSLKVGSRSNRDAMIAYIWFVGH